MNNMIIGGGEVGLTLYNLLDKDCPVVDKDKSKMKVHPFEEVDVMHYCIGYIPEVFEKYAVHYVSLYEPEVFVIHSTVPVNTSERIQSLLKIPVIYAPARGVHSRFEKDMVTYSKLWASVDDIDFDIEQKVVKSFTDMGMKCKRWDDPRALELAKVLTDTTYYGWLIAYRYASDMICYEHGVDKDKVWEFAEEIQTHLKNRPTMYSDPKGIGGHCVLPNLQLDSTSPTFSIVASVIESMNGEYVREMKTKDE